MSNTPVTYIAKFNQVVYFINWSIKQREHEIEWVEICIKARLIVA